MALKRNSAEGGTSGTTVSTSNSGGASGDAFGQITITGAAALTYANNVAAHGSLSYRAVVSAATDTAKAYMFNTGGNVGATRVYLYLNSLPSASQTLLVFQNASFSTSIAVAINASNKLFLTAGGSTLHTAPAALTAGTWYRIEMQATTGVTGASNTGAFQYYAGDSTTAIDSFTTSTATTGTDNIIRSIFGKLDSSGTLDANFDDLAYDDTTTTPIGPYTATNQAPIAYAGSDQSNVEAWSTVTLDGSGSTDADGTIASYAWTQTAGASVTLSSSTAVKPTFTAPGGLTNSTLTFSLTVTDNGGATSAADTVNIAVLAATERAVIGGVEVPVHTRVASGGTLV